MQYFFNFIIIIFCRILIYPRYLDLLFEEMNFLTELLKKFLNKNFVITFIDKFNGEKI